MTRYLATPQFQTAQARLEPGLRGKIEAALLGALKDPSRWREVRDDEPGKAFVVILNVDKRFVFVFFKHPMKDTFYLRHLHCR